VLFSAICCIFKKLTIKKKRSDYQMNIRTIKYFPFIKNVKKKYQKKAKNGYFLEKIKKKKIKKKIYF